MLYQYDTQDGVHKSGHCAQISVIPVRNTGRCAQIRTLCTNQCCTSTVHRTVCTDQDTVHKSGGCAIQVDVCRSGCFAQIRTVCTGHDGLHRSVQCADQHVVRLYGAVRLYRVEHYLYGSGLNIP